jgi:PEP-CTERM motif
MYGFLIVIAASAVPASVARSAHNPYEYSGTSDTTSIVGGQNLGLLSDGSLLSALAVCSVVIATRRRQQSAGRTHHRGWTVGMTCRRNRVGVWHTSILLGAMFVLCLERHAPCATYALPVISSAVGEGSDGSFTSFFDPTTEGFPGNELQVREGSSGFLTDLRSAIEFDLSTVPRNAMVSSALLEISVDEYQGYFDGTSNIDPLFEVNGYVGTGTVSLADMTAGSLLAGPLDPGASEPYFAIDVTSFVTSHLADQFAGFNLSEVDAPEIGDSIWFLGAGTSRALQVAPTLVVTTVPEPSTLVLAVAGFSMLVVLARRRFRLRRP